jgi:hypothetical protein
METRIVVKEAVYRFEFGAGDGTRTRNPQLGKLMRYHCATPAQEEDENGKLKPEIKRSDITSKAFCGP